jgi:E3 ubiquitin-protein ligase DOA10
MYVGTVREIIRPGVLWFIKDPNDPQFNAMREIMEKPILVQIRKLFTAIIFYGVLIWGVVGGSVGVIQFWDLFVTSFLSEHSVLKIFPLRMEYL